MEYSRTKRYAKYRKEIANMKDYTSPKEEEVLATQKEAKNAALAKKKSTSNTGSLKEIIDEFENYKDPSGEKRKKAKLEEEKLKRDRMIAIIVISILSALLLIGIILTIII